MPNAPFPESFAIFPLPNVVLFPDVQLPLHIFEPRYREMIRDTLRRERVIGMTLIRPGTDAGARRADVFEIGCAGHIVDCRQLPDGRFTLSLAGERRFRIRRELEADTLYRSVEAELLPDPEVSALAPEQRKRLADDRERLCEAVIEIAHHTAPDSAAVLEQRLATLDEIQLVHALAFGLDTTPLEKQGLLEAPDPVARSHMLIRLLEFRKAAIGSPDTQDLVH